MTMMTAKDWKRQKALLEGEASELQKKGDAAHSALYESVALMMSELEVLDASTQDLHTRLGHEEKRIQDMVHQMAGLESRVHEEVE
jgi:hypothetical protein